MKYRGEIRYFWGITSEEMEQKVQEGWAIIHIAADFGSAAPSVMAVMRRPLPEEKERMEVSGISA